MPEEGLETAELKEQLEEHVEHVEHARGGHKGGEEGHGKVGWILYLSLSTALTAVLAAVASLEAGATESHALLMKNEAILDQNRAADGWAHYQAKSLKQALYEIGQDTTDKPELIGKFKEKAAGYEKDKDQISEAASEEEKKRDEHNAEGEELLHHHHRFALAVTIFQIAIALSAISALTKLKPIWFFSLFAGAAGIAFFLLGFGLFGG